MEQRATRQLSEETIRGYLSDLLNRLEKDPARGRPALKRHVGAIVMTRTVEGTNRFYTAAGAFDHPPENIRLGPHC